MSSHEYIVFFTSASPFAAAEKIKRSVWKKADVITDFFNRETLKKARIDLSVRMLFDDEFLYINAKTLSHPSLVYSVDAPPSPWQNSHFCFYLPAADGKLMTLLWGEKGETAVDVDGETCSFSDIKTAVSSTQKKISVQWEGVFGIPLCCLAKDIKTFTAFDFDMYHVRNAVENADKEGSVVIVPDTQPSKPARLTARFSREEKKKAEKFAARKIYLEERKNVTLSLSPEDAGSSYKNILGMNNSPRISSADAMEKEKELFKRLSPARVRHHDAALVDSGYAVIDVSRIFPLFSADHNDPANYDFGPTDLCLEQVVECGTEIEFRFGESIEHSARRFRVMPPADPEKWAAVCVNILRHYNEKWADGKEWNISYASLWEEPDNIHLFDGPYEKYLELYKTFVRQMKKAFPKVKVGGPQCMYLSRAEALAVYCKENDLVLDFLTTTQYARFPESLVQKMQELRDIADKHGFHDAEIFLSEWNMGPRDWKNLVVEEAWKNSMKKAAFAAASLIALQDIADMAYFYIWASRSGIWPLFHSWREPFKLYYALTFYTEFIQKKLKKVPVTISAANAGIYYLAGVDKAEKIHLLLSVYTSPAESLTLALPEPYRKCKIKILSNSFPTGEGTGKIKSSGKGTFHLPLEEKLFGVYLLEFEK